MIKSLASILFASTLIASPSSLRVPSRSNSQQFNYVDNGEYLSITGVKDEYLSNQELRIYGKDYDPNNLYVKEVKENAFEGASFNKIMISKDVEIFSESLDNKIVYYTGNQLEFATFAANNDLNVNNFTIFYEACDEGFLRFWKDNISSLESICDVVEDKDLYDKLISLYHGLEDTLDKKVVDETEIDGSTIKDLVKYLSSLIDPEPTPAKKSELSQDTMLTFILIIAAIGMTAITVFYLLKDKNIIE